MSWVKTSKKTGHEEIITDDEHEAILRLGIDKRFMFSEMKERKLKEVPTIKPPELLTKTKNKKSNG
jgi:hypothetical protein